MSWIQDGVSTTESYPVSALAKAALPTDRVFYALLDKPWVRDGLTAEEAFTIDELVRIALRGLGAESTRILGMPFMEDFEVVDYYAVRCLAFFSGASDGRYLRNVLDHPSLAGRITDDDTLTLAGMWYFSRFSPDNLEKYLFLLDADKVYVQERTLALPLAGETTLKVIRESPGTFRTIDIIEELVHQYEGFMHVAYPFKTLPIFIVDNEGPRGRLKTRPDLLCLIQGTKRSHGSSHTRLLTPTGTCQPRGGKQRMQKVLLSLHSPGLQKELRHSWNVLRKIHYIQSRIYLVTPAAACSKP